MKKHINQKEMKKIAKTALAMVLAGTFTFSSSIAFANETNTENNIEAVELQTNASEITTVTNGTDATTTPETVQAKEEITKPSLVPGDFFYFAKLTIEKIQLILTTDDIKEAKLYAQFASERLAEAQSLLEDGEEEKALETIQKALEVMANADSVITGDLNTEFPAVEVEGDAEATETTETTEATETTETTETTEKTDATDTTQTPEVSETTTESTVTVEAPKNDEEAVNEIEEILSQNIIALTAAMEKVKNPVAKAALQKNIEKSYAKLAKKLAKIEARLAKEADEIEEELENQELTDTNDSEVEGSTEVEIKTEVETEVETETDVTSETNVENETTTVVPTKNDVKNEVKQARKEIKEKAKNEIKTIKQEAKSSLKELHGKKQNERKAESKGKENKNEKQNKNNKKDRD